MFFDILNITRYEKSHGGIAQLARAFGSYPKCHWFKSSCRYQRFWEGFPSRNPLRPVGQAVKTRPFHGWNMGSIPVRVIKNTPELRFGGVFYVSRTRNRTGRRTARGFAGITILRVLRRHGYYAARCSQSINATYRVNRTGRIYASPTNLPEICIFPNYTLPFCGNCNNTG